jgi:NNP family nitrate/nitrite transporter-like MFS transporter
LGHRARPHQTAGAPRRPAFGIGIARLDWALSHQAAVEIVPFPVASYLSGSRPTGHTVEEHAMSTPSASAPAQSKAHWVVLILSTVAFTLMFNVWMMLGVLAPRIKDALGLSATQVEWMIATAILAGALFRMTFGIWADRYGGRNVMLGLMLLAVVPTYLFSRATSYPEMLACVFLFGLAGNAFTVGIAWNSAWFQPDQKGLALGTFGAGNVGAAGTKLLVGLFPAVMTAVPAAGLLGGLIPGGWRFIPAFYAVLLLGMVAAILALAPRSDPTPGRGRPLRELLEPLKHARVWRFSLYYVVVFGAYVALSGWLPTFYKETYNVSLRTAALLTALYIFPASLLRPLGGWLSDRYGPRVVTYAVFITMAVGLVALSVPYRTYWGVPYRLGPASFSTLLFLVGCAMGIGKASVFKYIPNYFPDDVGAVGGLVGMLGALGGFFLPPVFGGLGRSTGVPQMAFAALLGLTVWSLAWLHLTVVRIHRAERLEQEMPAGIGTWLMPDAAP